MYDPDDAIGRLLFNVLAMVAEFEAALIRIRTVGGMRVAKAKGHLRGKLPKFTIRPEAHLIELMNSGSYSTGEVAELFGVARSTVYRAQQRAKAKSATSGTSAETTVSTVPDPFDRRPRHATAR